MNCSTCYFEVMPGVAFCGNCGAAVSVAPTGSKPRNLVAVILKAVSIPLFCNFFIVLPLVVMNNYGEGRLFQAIQILPYFTVGGVIIYIAAHFVDLSYLRKKIGIASWILELLGIIAFLPVGILLIIAAHDSFFHLGRSAAIALIVLQVAALVLIAIRVLLAGIRSRHS